MQSSTALWGMVVKEEDLGPDGRWFTWTSSLLLTVVMG